MHQVREDDELAAKVASQFGGDWTRFLTEVHYDFRQCGKCKQPFKAGLKQCGAAGAAADAGEADLDAIRCDACQNNEKANCPKHGKEFIAWKVCARARLRAFMCACLYVLARLHAMLTFLCACFACSPLHEVPLLLRQLRGRKVFWHGGVRVFRLLACLQPLP